MRAKRFDKSKRSSRLVTAAPSRALVSVATCCSEGVPVDSAVMHPTPSTKKAREIVKCKTNQRVVDSVSNPISAMGGVVGLDRSLAPEGAIVKVAKMTTLDIKGPAHCLDGETELTYAVSARPKLSGTSTFNRSSTRRAGMMIAVVAVMLGTAIGFSGMTAARDLKFASPQAAYEQGFSAYKNGFYEIAIPALSSAATSLEPSKRLFAEFYLAQIYADNTGSQTDHTKAYTLYRGIVEAHADIDPDDRLRAPFVARSLTAVANYVRRGILDFGLKPDAETALDFYSKAATWFDEPDAQFELAKLHLIGEGVPQDIKVGLHYLQKLVHQSHAPAQAFLADLQWQGKIVPREPEKALALIRMAVENAHRTDRLWIDDIYHKVYCGTTKDVRANSDGLVMRWKQLFARPRFEEAPSALGVGDLKPSRICRNGEPLKEIERGAGNIGGGIADAINAFTAPLTPRSETRPVGSPAPQR